MVTLLNIIFNAYRIYFQDQGKKGVKAAVYLMVVPTAIFCVIFVTVGAHYLFPGHFATYRVLKIAGVQLLSSVLITQGLEKRYLTNRPIEIEFSKRKYQKGLLHTLGPVYCFGSFFFYLVTSRYTDPSLGDKY